MRIFNGITEFEKAIGTHLGVSDWFPVTQKQIDLFADATGDHQWIHVDPDAAAAGPFGAPIAHGFLTLSLLPVLAEQIWRVDGLKMVVNYGCNKVRFPSVVKVGDKVRAGAELTAVTPTPAGTQITITATVEIDGGAKPACVAEWVLLLVE
ncbi:MaoC family dehydratase [Rhodococcus sp. T7]|uniref:MaoC family dehydratase n=1 Tax=Rhodococcus sp. T7 TaxID=627444 RepID=UPI001358AF6D|nr:MaoC family dehydratase [Rhodococcus sp. T7]KAF0957252.1 putative enoyl-CoA hydratase 1 [Rhodococcus sp. T7]KAF0966712.1 putative enoyl-CoA hydratase 1 [Rhodococcus sp. T7]